MKLRSLLVAGIGLALAASLVSAGEEGGKKVKGQRGDIKKKAVEDFKKMDADGNGSISLEEFTTFHNARMAARKAKMGDKWNEERAKKMPPPEEIFKRIDADADGQVSPVELQASAKKSAAQMQRMKKKKMKERAGDDKIEADDKE